MAPRINKAQKGQALLLLTILNFYRELGRSLLSLATVIALFAIGLSAPQPTPTASKLNDNRPAKLAARLQQTQQRLDNLQKLQRAKGVMAVRPETLDLNPITAAAAKGHFVTAVQGIKQISSQLDQAEAKLQTVSKSGQAHAAAGSLQVPILMYHKTPADFEQQLMALQQKGYTTISLDELAGAFYTGLPLPPKPAIITYDDGFADQMQAYELLAKYQMKATYYIINGGAASSYCIGAGRHADAPCGDAYLNWDQIKFLDQNPLITIAAHTVDHANLAALPENARWFELAASKSELEARLGHPINHLAYPYGSFSPDVIATAQSVGFVTAVTTVAGIDQNPADIFALKRVRDAYSLP
jgi:peptidoglycan/xylan/chitin deacetylase (PgdA/CDA1 family)